MCGRYAASANPEDLVEEFEVQRVDVRERLQPDYNVAPTKDVYAVLTRRPHGAPTDAAAERQLRVLRWGLVPSWAKDLSIGSRMINARIETVADKPAFRRAFAARRCLLPADGYYEWYAGHPDPRTGKPRKQPFFIRPKDGSTLAMAGIYEFWRPADADPDDATAWVTSCAVLTTQAEDDLGRIHDRMPLLVEPDRWAEWLDPDLVGRVGAQGLLGLLGLLVPAAPGRLDAYPVSTAVNSVANNGPELVEPLPTEPPDEPPDEPADGPASDAARLF